MVRSGVALETLGLGAVTRHLSSRDIAEWLARHPPRARRYPDVTGALSEWLGDGAREPLEELSQRLWRQVTPERSAA